MRSYLSITLFLLSFLPRTPYSYGDDLSFCYSSQSICAIGNDLFDLCNDQLSDPDPTVWYQCICTNGYVAVDEACYWCQLAYDLEPIYTPSTKQQCIDDNIPIAPIPASALSVGSAFNATYTGIISGGPQTKAPATSTSDGSSPTTTDGGGVGESPQTTEGDGSAATSSIDSLPTSSPDVYVITTTLPPSTGRSFTSPSSTFSTSPVGQSSSKNRSSNSGGLSTGAKAGIAVGCVLVTLLIIALIWVGIILSRIAKQKAAQNQSQPQNTIPPHQSVLGPGMVEMDHGQRGEQYAVMQMQMPTPATSDVSSGTKVWPWGERGSYVGPSENSTSPVTYYTGSPQPQTLNTSPNPAISELSGSSVIVPQGAGLPPDGSGRLKSK